MRGAHRRPKARIGFGQPRMPLGAAHQAAHPQKWQGPQEESAPNNDKIFINENDTQTLFSSTGLWHRSDIYF